METIDLVKKKKAAPKVSVQKEAPPKQTDALTNKELVEAWFKEVCHNSVLSRDTECFNHLRKSVDVLKSRLM